MEDERWLMMAVLDHLQKASSRGDLKEEPLQEAIFAIANAYSLNMHNSATKARYPLDNLSLPEVFKAGRAQLLGKDEVKERGDGSVEPEMMDIDKSSSGVKMDAGFEKFVARLKQTTSIFKGIDEGSTEYERRLSRAREKYDAKLASKKSSGSGIGGSSSTGSRGVPLVSGDVKAEAEKLKAEGNSELKAKNYQRAHELYSRCIEMDGSNAVFYSNRAAANLHLELYMEAVEDCKKAISLDGSFVRPRERLASAYRFLGMTDKEVEALSGAVGIAPQNESLQMQLRDAETRLGGGGGGDGGGGDGFLGGVNPAMMDNVARAMGLPEGAVESFMNSPAANQIKDMLMNNPGLVQNAMAGMMGGNMGAFGGAGGGGSGGGGGGGGGGN